MEHTGPPPLLPQFVDLVRRTVGVKRREPDGLLWAYRPLADGWRVGYRSCWNWREGRPVARDVRLTQWEAEEWLRWDLEAFAQQCWAHVQQPVWPGLWSGVVWLAWEWSPPQYQPLDLGRWSRCAVVALLRGGSVTQARGRLAQPGVLGAHVAPVVRRRWREAVTWGQGETHDMRRSKDMPVVHHLRQQRDLSQWEVAQALGVSQATIAVWERGYREPSPGQIQQLAVLYRVAERTIRAALTGKEQ